ncbi:voltage-gated potassium channel [Durotheca rogersii]|uniref:voltage-gated potassium channel n=1 Tax=Durotheca rogersii TaxID=419775 RepID=UPI00221EA95C|nr:voltage-gated potassium channel [Durotheca rogersii]KAI5866252.1 voltage-gated potassium channel [Durotheca rogersii]
MDEQTQTINRSDDDNRGRNAIMSNHVQLGPGHPPSLRANTRWWFASAAFPMVAGTLGPVASAFSICALVESWRQHIPPGGGLAAAVFVPDPRWLLALNAVQLVIALAANMFLLLNMTKRVGFCVAQPITIVGWYISAIILVSLCATASGPLLQDPPMEYVWSQAFYYGIFAAVLYFIVASLMTITFWGAQTGHYDKNFELTSSQRTLMLQTIVFLSYLLLGALVFSKIENWNFLDAVYWADVTLFTVGLGDICPQTRLGRGLLIPFALIGIISLGLVIGSIRSLILDRGRHRFNTRMLEKQRRLLIRRESARGEPGIFEPIGAETDNTEPNFSREEFMRRQKEFQLMRKIQHQKWTSMAISAGTWFTLWLVGAKVFQECESQYQGWTYFDSFYFAFTTLTTVGYGDLSPVSSPGRPFFVFWSLLAVPTMTVLISNASDTIVKAIKEATLILGSITILPGGRVFKKDIEYILGELSCGATLSDEDIEEDPPGFLGAGGNTHIDEGKDEAEEEYGGSSSSTSDLGGPESQRVVEKDVERGGLELLSHGANSTASVGNGASKSTRVGSTASDTIPNELPKTRAEYRLVLIDEIMRVTQHLRQSPARKYTFKEWAWYLRLIGEDESNAETHRDPEHPFQILDSDPRGGRPKWSWVGHRSPLMDDTRVEAEWIVERLERKLHEELLRAAGAGARQERERGGLPEERRGEGNVGG